MAGDENGGLSAAEIAAMYALVRAQAAARRQVEDAVAAIVSQAWSLFTGWYSSAEIGALGASVLRVVQPLQRRAASVTDAYVARQLSLVLGRRVEPVGVVDVSRLRRALPEVGEQVAALRARADAELADARDGRWFTGGFEARGSGGRDDRWFTGGFEPRDVDDPRDFSDEDDGRGFMDPLVVYGRPADTYRFEVSRGATPEVARQAAVRRAETIAVQDVALAVRAQSRKTMVARGRGVTGYRRVVHPELSQDGVSCGLCVVAASRVYRLAELLPLHPGCNCTTAPITAGADPGLVLNDRDLAALYGAAGGTTAGRRLQNRVRVSITEHGELGPVLVRSNHKFRSPGDVAARKVSVSSEQRRRASDRAQVRAVRRAESVESQVAALERSLEAMARMTRRGEGTAALEDLYAERRAELDRLRNVQRL